MTLLCIAGKNTIATRALDHARTLSGVEVAALPNPDDGGEDGWQPSFRRHARDIGVEVVDLEHLAARDDLVLVSLEYSRIVKTASFASDRLFNVHFSLLPKFRGCNTSIWPILLGEAHHGVTLHVMDSGVDSGPIIDQIAFDIRPQATSRDLYLRCLELGFDIFRNNVARLLDGSYGTRPQNEAEQSTFRRDAIDYENIGIDFQKPNEAVSRQIRAFSFKEYQLPPFQGHRIAAFDLLDGTFPGNPGDLISVTPETATVRTVDGAVHLKLVS